MEDIFNQIEEEDKNLVLSNNKNIVLVLGNYDDEQRIFTRFIVDNDLISKESGPDTGEYIFEDSHRNNNNSMLYPESLLPKFFIDTKTDTTYYNCPGFNNPHNYLFEAGVKYFIQKIIYQAEKIKFIFIINHQSVQMDNESTNFLELLKHATGLIRNIDKFANSITMIITKVQNNYIKKDNKIELVSDIKLINNIVQYFEYTRSNLNSQLNGNGTNEENEIFYKNAIKFIDILIQKNDDNYPRLGIFRLPQRPGYVSKMHAMRKCRQKLINIIQNNTEFVKNIDADFGDIISVKSKNGIYNLIEDINKNATKNTFQLSQDIFDYFTLNEKNFKDLQLAQDHFDSSYTLMKTALDNMASPNDMIYILKNFFNDYKVKFSINDLNGIIKLSKYLNILQLISANKLNIKFEEWKISFEKMVKKLDDTKNWYKFLTNFQLKLSDYYVQRDTELFSLNQLEHKIEQVIKLQKILYLSNIKVFLNQIYFDEVSKGYPIQGYDEIKNLEIDEYKRELFVEILKFSLQNKPEIICNQDNQLIIRGFYVKLSEILNVKCPENIKIIKIFALNKIFIDDNLIRKKGNLEISIISPIWEIIGERNIDLFGRRFLGIGRIIPKTLNVIGADRSDNKNICIIKLNNIDNSIQEAIDFTAYLRENINIGKGYQNMFYFHEELIYDFILLENNNIFGYINVFRSYEDQFLKLKKTINFQPLYESLSERILKHAKDLKVIPNDNKKALNYLYTAVLSKICGFKHGLYDNLIIDVREYINIILKNVKDFEKLSNSVRLSEYNKEYKQGIDKKIEEANDLISKYIIPEINNIINTLNESIEELIEEIVKLQKLANERNIDLQKKKKKLEDMAKLRAVFGALQSFAGFLSFLGPLGALVSSAVSSTVNVAKSLTLDDTDAIQAAVKLPEGIKNIIDEKKKYLKEQGEKLKDERKNGCLGVFLRNNKKSKSTKNTDYGNITTHVVKSGVNIYNDYQTKDLPRIKVIDEAIKQNNQAIQQIQHYKEKIYNFMKPMVEDMEVYVNETAEASKNKTLIALDVSKWQVHSTISEIKKTMRKFTEGSKVQDEVVDSIEKLDEAMDVMMQIYQHIQYYGEQKTFADYIHNILSVGSTNIVVDNKELYLAINNLEMQIKSNIILDQYARLAGSLKQFIFPFAGLYFDEFNMPEHLQIKNDNISSLVFETSQKIENLQSKLIESDVTINKKYDQYINSGAFYQSKPFGAFYVWKNKNFNEIIVNLLAGKEILLNADVTANNINAVKFTKIDLIFSIKNQTLNHDLQNVLLNYKIRLTHLGKSYYKCDNKIYAITSDSQIIEYTFDKDANGEPEFANNVYKKIKNSDFILSPYTMWKIQLIDNTGIGYKELEKYGNNVDLELSGYGQYVKSDSYICKNDLEKYYVLHKTINYRNNDIDIYKHRLKRQATKFPAVTNLTKYSKILSNPRFDYQTKLLSLNAHNHNIKQYIKPETLKLDTNKTNKSFNVLDLSVFNFTNTLALTNYLIRKLTGIKEKSYGENYDDSNYSNSLIKTMEIIEKFEKNIKNFAQKKNISIDDSDFDSINLIEPIKKEIINGNVKNIPKILYKTLIVKENFSRYGIELYENIAKMDLK